MQSTQKCELGRCSMRASPMSLPQLSHWPYVPSSIFAMAAIELFALKEQLRAKPKQRGQLSFAKSLRAVRVSLQHLTDRPEHVDSFDELLAAALLDSYERTRSKSARYHPQTKDKPSCGSPVVTRATLKHRQRLKQLELQNAA